MEKGWKLRRQEGKLKKGRWKIENWSRKSSKKSSGPRPFENDRNLFWVYQNGNFLLGKSISRREKIRKNDFAPSEKYACYAPAWVWDNLSKPWTKAGSSGVARAFPGSTHIGKWYGDVLRSSYYLFFQASQRFLAYQFTMNGGGGHSHVGGYQVHACQWTPLTPILHPMTPFFPQSRPMTPFFSTSGGVVSKFTYKLPFSRAPCAFWEI